MDKISPETHIIIKGARVHNLKNIDVAILRNKITVITGVSGSGKSSLAFDTLFNEGQRRYVESLSSYARLFLGKLDKPDVDNIKGISPAIAIEQKVKTNNPRSTVGTSTEIYDYLKLLFARTGTTISPISGKKIKKDQTKDILNLVHKQDEKTKALILSPLITPRGRTLKNHLQIIKDQGFDRLFYKEKLHLIDSLYNEEINEENLHLVIDRIACNKNNENSSRINESTETAFMEGNGECSVYLYSEINQWHHFNNRFEENGILFEEPSLDFFSFNNPLGACPTCEGFGKIMGIDKDLVIPNPTLSVYENGIACWRGEKMKKWKDELILHAQKFNFPIHKPIKDLTKTQQELIWNGNEYFKGLNAFFTYLEKKNYKIQYRVMMARYRGKTNCPDCNGNKLRKDANYVKINNTSISDISNMSIDKAIHFFDALKFSKNKMIIAKRILLEIKSRLNYLSDVGLGYLTLNRLSNTLSGGESQRINLATSLGSSLIGSMYILDEPSIGLHPRDTNRLIKILEKLRNIGNTVIIVEHEEEIMRSADEIIDIGPMAGTNGGEIVFQGKNIYKNSSENSLTAQYLSNKMQIPIPEKRRKWNNYIFLESVSQNNLKEIDLKIPLNVMTVITGVSGSGKSSLVNDVLFNFLKKHLEISSAKPINCKSISGDLQLINHVEYINQNPIGKSSRSNPVTYIKAFDEIRNLFANQHTSKINGYKPKHFSFNVDGGRCDECEGEGALKIEMQFMSNVMLTCESCNGKRYKDDILEVLYKEKSISDILKMTIDEALVFFNDPNDKLENKIKEKITPLQDVGLGYVQLGQSSSTLSGGESQRIKLASFLGKKNDHTKTLFIFDEPTIGLHFHDIKKLLLALNALIEKGNHIIIIEHNTEIIKSADWVIDLGPEGGDEGGQVIFEGTPEDLISNKKSYTGKYLAEKISPN